MLPILLLDKATARMDHTSKEWVLETLWQCAPEWIMVMIAHRLQTIRVVGRILLLDGECIAMAGAHEQILVHSSAYRKLVRTSERCHVARTT